LIKEKYFYQYEEASLHYLFYRGGPDVLLCFHGYGQQAQVFEPLARRLSSQYSIYSFDLFFHGQSKWPDCERAIPSEFFSEVITNFLDDRAIRKVCLCGYSLGGKIVLNLVEKLGHLIKKIMLIAPDGIKTNFWYSLATYPYWMRRLFKYSVHHPEPFFFLSNVLSQSQMLDKGVAKFAKRQMNTAAKREKVYCTWLAYRKIQPDIQKVVYQLKRNNIPVYFILGTYDRIIHKSSIKPLTEKISSFKIQMLDRGHNTLIKDIAKDPKLNF
jgi:pimeloyl-ACP methyl ester carboxylesterase